MATVVGQPSSEPSGGPPRAPDSSGSARAALAARESPRRRLVRLLILLIAIGVLVKGWMVTDIDLGKLANAPNAAPILKSLVTPDVVSRDIVQVELDVPVVVGAGSNGPATASAQTGQTFKVEPGSPVPGGAVAFDGTGFAPNATGQIRVQNPSRGIDALWLRVTTDDTGSFHADSGWSDYSVFPPDIYHFHLTINAPGATHISDTFVNSLSRIGETILLALMGTVFGVLISAPLSFLGARNLMGGSAVGQAIYWIVRLIFTITRSIEVLILGVIMVVIVGIGSYAGVLAIVVHSVGSLGKLYSEAIEGIEPGPVEAITATGANRLATVLYGVVPQVVPTFLSVTIYWWDHNVRMSTVLGLVGGGGIGFLLIQYMNLLQFNQAATVLWMIVIVVTLLDYASAAIRSRLV
ncbi:MAG: phosphonate ABC transporter, permease protein PhnE [Chloroflexi bacterium]|nr:phosphonate ABC transporter, permease protein PhnE [Chloroflexota bacterium]